LQELLKENEEFQSIPLQVFQRKGLSLDLFKKDIILEVRLKEKPLKQWFCRVVRNVGGRLLLQWVLPCILSEAQQTFWLFFCHPRIQARRVSNYDNLEPPIIFENWEEEKERILNEYTKDDEEDSLRSFMIESTQKTRPRVLAHDNDLRKGSTVLTFPSNLLKLLTVKVEAITHPAKDNEAQACIRLKGCMKADDNEKEVSFYLPYDDTNCILPNSWSEENEIPIQSTFLDKAEEFKLKTSERISEFKSNGKIEVVHPDDPEKVCEAVIIRVTPPLIWVQVSLERIHVLPFNSTEMFPHGWCDNNDYPLTKLLPKIVTSKNEREEQRSRKQTAMDDDNSNSLPLEVSSLNSNGAKGWCPRIYFNYKCFTGPSLSKSKLCNLPRFVGPGPVLLVMQEVISKILSIAYVSSKILNDLASEHFAELLEEHNIFKIELVQFKAKYNNSQKTNRLEIPIIRSSDKIEEYCHLMCSHLKCCFNLLGPKLYDGDTCPSNCRRLTKSNKILKRPDFFRQQAITASQFLKGEIEVATFDNIKLDGPTKNSGRGRPKGKRPTDSTAATTVIQGSNSNSGSDNESSNKKPRLEDSPIPKPKEKKKKKYKGYRIMGDELLDETTQSSFHSGVATYNEDTKKDKYFDDPLCWSVNRVHKFLMDSNSSVFASQFRDHVSIIFNEIKEDI
jgi:hypothetical protein